MKHSFQSSDLFLRTKGQDVSNETVPSNRCSPEDMLSEFESKARHSDMMEGSDQDHLYFFSKKCKYRTIMEFVLLLLDVIKYVFEGMHSEWKDFLE